VPVVNDGRKMPTRLKRLGARYMAGAEKAASAPRERRARRSADGAPHCRSRRGLGA